MLPLPDVPIGKDETKNKIIYENGKIPKFDFKFLNPMMNLGKNLDMMDFDLANKNIRFKICFFKK